MKKLVLATCVALSACATPTVSRYTASTNNVLALRSLKLSGIGVGLIAEPVKDDIKCRGIGQVRLQDGKTHAQYILGALRDELRLADAYAETNPRVTLNGRLVAIDSSSGLGSSKGVWFITLQLDSSNGKSMTVEEAYTFRSGFAASAACNNVAQAFTPAVQDLIAKVISSPGFPALVK